MVNIDLSEWPRLLEPKRSVFSFKKKHLGESFPKFDWKVEEGECPELSPGRLPLADSESAKTIYLYNEQAVMQRLNDDGWLGSQNLLWRESGMRTIRRMCGKTY